MADPVHRLEQERPSGPVVWRAPSRQVSLRQWLPALILVIAPVIAWMVFAYILS